MISEEIKIVNRLGLHARASAQLVRLAGKYKSRLKLIRQDNSVVADAKSILSVLTLAAAKGAILRLEAEGEDENEAFEATANLIRNGFGE